MTGTPSPTTGLDWRPSPPPEILWTLTNAIVPARCLQLVAELGIADSIGDEAVGVGELAVMHRVDAEALDRVLCLLAAHGIFGREDGEYSHTPTSLLLRSDNPMSMRAFSRMMGLPVINAAFANLMGAVRSGAPGTRAVHPGGLWAYLQEHPDEERIFAEAMGARAGADIVAILDSYDFAPFASVADIGGGHGHLLRAIIDRAPDTKGFVFDLPTVIGAIEPRHDRISYQPGDFFVDPVPTAHLYVLMEVLHDWADTECKRILHNIRKVAAPDARLLVIEEILPSHGDDPKAHTLDVIMLGVTGGRERTLNELNTLFERSGFQAARMIDTDGRVRIVETTVAP